MNNRSRGAFLMIAAVLALPVVLALPQLALADQYLGEVDFPNSGSAQAQGEFLRGVLLLHSFEYEDAREAFVAAQSVDPKFAMAYWGEAMTHNHPLWGQQDREAAIEALERLAPTADGRAAACGSDRERDYLAALEVLYAEGAKAVRDHAYSAAMEALSLSYPDDLEARAFYALSILGTVPERDFRTYMRAAAVAEEVFAANPRHPGAVHYMIHSYDDPVHAPLGLRAARVYAQIAPAAVHAQHMISHIYTALGWWDEVVSANEKAVRVSEERLERKGLPPYMRTKHSLLWLEYGLLQQGRWEEAWSAMSTMAADFEADPSPMQGWHYAQMRAAHVVADPHGENSPAAVDLGSASLSAVAVDLFASGYRAASQADLAATSKAAEALRHAMEEADVSPPEAGRNAYQGASSDPDIVVAGIMALELEALVALAEGHRAEALELMEQAVAAEQARPLEYGPPSVPKPSHELLGEMLLSEGRADEARERFSEALERAPRRSQSLIGLAQACAASGDAEAAAEAWAGVRDTWKRGEPLARQLLDEQPPRLPAAR